MIGLWNGRTQKKTSDSIILEQTLLLLTVLRKAPVHASFKFLTSYSQES